VPSLEGTAVTNGITTRASARFYQSGLAVRERRS
jgi:hypothetical protein